VGSATFLGRSSRQQIDAALLVLRLFLGIVLIYGTQDNVFNHERMLEFRDFVAAHRFPAPLFSAYLSAYAQFICGILIVLGLMTRAAALVMVMNFVMALGMVHWGLPFTANISPLAMLFNSLCLVISGAGAHSGDGYIERRTSARALA
jgi:putative oxidoreductase